MSRLRHLAEINPATPEFEHLPSDAEVPFVPLEAVWPGGVDSTRRKLKGEATTGYTRFREGDIVVPKITPTFQANRTTIAAGLEGGVAAGTTELHVVRPGPNVDGRYVRYLLSSRPFLHGGEAEMIGVAGQKRVPDAWLRDLGVPIGSVAEQRAIADFLDAETVRIDALIAKKRHLIELLGERFSAKVTALFGGGMPDLPEYWERLPLRRISPEVTVGVVVNPSTYFTESGVPFVHGTDIGHGHIDQTKLKFMSEASNRLLRKSQLRAEDVVVMRVGEPGRSAVVPPSLDRANCASVLIVRRGEVLRSEILAEFLNSPLGKSQIAARQYGAAQAVLNVSDALDLRVPVPPLAEQAGLSEILDDERRRLEIGRELIGRQVDLLVEHRQALITAAVTGELAVSGVAA